ETLRAGWQAALAGSGGVVVHAAGCDRAAEELSRLGAPVLRLEELVRAESGDAVEVAGAVLVRVLDAAPVALVVGPACGDAERAAATLAARAAGSAGVLVVAGEPPAQGAAHAGELDIALQRALDELDRGDARGALLHSSAAGDSLDAAPL